MIIPTIPQCIVGTITPELIVYQLDGLATLRHNQDVLRGRCTVLNLWVLWLYLWNCREYCRRLLKKDFPCGHRGMQWNIPLPFYLDANSIEWL